MSDNIQPTNFNPIMCDFGPFAGKVCAGAMITGAPTATSNIKINDIIVTTLENVQKEINLKNEVESTLDIDWSNVVFSSVNGGTINYNDGILTFMADTAPTTNRTIRFSYTVTDTLNTKATAQINID